MNVVITEKVVKVVEVDWIALAKAVENGIMHKLYDDLKDWPDDISLRAMCIDDASRAMRVCELLELGMWKEAEKRLYAMDTSPREYLYEWIEQNSCKDFFKVLREETN
jgi:hypothetical protein